MTSKDKQSEEAEYSTRLNYAIEYRQKSKTKYVQVHVKKDSAFFFGSIETKKLWFLPIRPQLHWDPLFPETSFRLANILACFGSSPQSVCNHTLDALFSPKFTYSVL